jgi:hypothetical protein
VVTYGGKVISTFYSSSTGGATDTNEDAWGSSPIAYLRSVPDPWSLDPKINPNASWASRSTAGVVASWLGWDWVTSISVVERNVSGTARTVRFTGFKGTTLQTTTRTGGQVTSAFGLRSRYFDVAYTAAAPPWVLNNGDQVVMHERSSGIFRLRTVTGTVNSFFFGNPGDVPFMGDWDCDGVKTPGLYRQSDGYVYLRNSNTQGVADVKFFFGNPGDVPLAGDFDGDGCDTVSIYRPAEGRFYIINRLGSGDAGLGAADTSFLYGNPGDVPFVGDWNGDGVDTPGLRRSSNGFVYLRNSNSQGVADLSYFYGDPGDQVLVGDWNGNGIDTLGLYRPSNGVVYLRNTNTTGVADVTFSFPGAGLRSAGSWGG